MPPERRERPSREALLRSYRERDESRARDARARSQDLSSSRRIADPSQRHPLSAQESRDLTQTSREAHEKARALRNARIPQTAGRTTNRELIDARGSIDSRAFNEHNELVGYSIDKNDKPEPLLDAMDSGTRWNSRGQQGFVSSDARMISNRERRMSRRQDLGSLSDTISGRAQYGSKGSTGVPKAVIFLVILIVILLIVLVYILFF